MTILSLQHKMTDALALGRLDSPGVLSFIQRRLRGRLHGIAEIHVPYRLYKVTVQDRGIHKAWFYAVDAASGTLDPYEFASPLETQEWVEVETRNCYPVRLREEETRTLAIEKVRRLLFLHGFFRVTHPCLTAQLVASELYLPYWVGFYASEQDMNLRVLNALRETMEGTKMCHLIKTWLLEEPTAESASCEARVGSSC